MIVIDGSAGEGGGQVVRNALALALVTGRPFRIDRIRGGRKKPGLMRQHVTAIEAACAIGHATCDGLAVGSSALEFRPGAVQAGSYRFSIGTAGSTSLVLQTVLLPLLLAGRPSTLTIEGGTHNDQAPPFDFIERAFLPLIRRMGPAISARLERRGFYPAGGGRIVVDISPAPLARVDLVERGRLVDTRARALVASVPTDVAERELASARRGLDWPADAFTVEVLTEARGPGNVLLLEAGFEHVTEIVTGFGQPGVPAESIGRTSAARMRGYLASAAFAGPYLADQLLLPMALGGGGSFTTVKPSQHTLTAIEVIRRFVQRDIRVETLDNGTHLVTIR